ncbi:hypothetical protein BDV59DRAFT_208978 [Aspergillus ambiguus]|uniref:putative pyridine nucleotide-disulfide oxidoreductase AMID-like n=1 Tax=Aspergillus ambiguus TaxID=176160 RepID=UPI003CCD84DA
MSPDERIRCASRPFRVLIAGGSYGGLGVALTLLDLCNGRVARFNHDNDAKPPGTTIPLDITIVDERDGFYHLIGSPKALACEEYASKTWIKYADIPALTSSNVQFIRGSVDSINTEDRIAGIRDLESNASRQVQYDFMVASTGLRRAFPAVPNSLKKLDFLNESRTHEAAIRDAPNGVAIVGGGAVGVEIAAELKVLNPSQKVTIVHSRDRLLSAEPLPDDFKERVAYVLQKAGVNVILSKRVMEIAESKKERRVWALTLADKSNVHVGHVINATSKSAPTSSYLPQDVLDNNGYVMIRSSLQFPDKVAHSEHHFAVGDIASWAPIKRCGGAIHMGYYAGHNIHQLMLSETFNSQPQFLNLQDTPAVIALAVGIEAVSYSSPEGTQHGKDLMNTMFGDDMGFSICWNYMRLSEPYKP